MTQNCLVTCQAQGRNLTALPLYTLLGLSVFCQESVTHKHLLELQPTLDVVLRIMQRSPILCHLSRLTCPFFFSFVFVRYFAIACQTEGRKVTVFSFPLFPQRCLKDRMSRPGVTTELKLGQ